MFRIDFSECPGPVRSGPCGAQYHRTYERKFAAEAVLRDLKTGCEGWWGKAKVIRHKPGFPLSR